MQNNFSENPGQNKSNNGKPIENMGEFHEIINETCEANKERIDALDIKTAPRGSDLEPHTLTREEKEKLIGKRTLTELLNKENFVKTRRRDVENAVRSVIERLES